MKIERILTDGNGKFVHVVIDIDEAGDALERAITRLANKARRSKTGKVTALDGAVRLQIREEAVVPTHWHSASGAVPDDLCEATGAPR